MFGMSLPTGQQRVLEKIEGRLAESDPRLASLFTIFTRLTLTEKMPWIEQIRARPVAYRIGRIAAGFRGIGRRPAARVRAMLLLPAALTAMACALTIAFGFPGTQRPAPGARTPAARELVVKPRALAVKPRAFAVKPRALVGRARMCRAIVRAPVFAC
jgi:Protein of unknown function (DUF3040)